MAISLVTGGAGFMGSHIAEHLLNMGHEVIILDDLSGGFEDNVPQSAKFVKASICDYDIVNHVFKTYTFDYVYHMAAYAAEGLSHFIKRFNYNNNLIGSVNLINASVNHGVRCFVFTSSIAVYGSAQTPMTEDIYPLPEDSYGVAKLAVEHELRASKIMFGLDHIIFRPHNVYGERQNIGDRYRNVVGIFMNQLLKGEPMTIFGDGTQKRAFTHIDDVAPIIAHSVNVPEAYNKIFNVGADLPYSVNELAQIVAQAMGAENTVKYLPARKEVKEAFSDHRKCDAIFGTRERICLQEGISRMAEWVKKHGARTSGIFENIEVMINMPASWAELIKMRHKRVDESVDEIFTTK